LFLPLLPGQGEVDGMLTAQSFADLLWLVSPALGQQFAYKRDAQVFMLKLS